MPRSRIKGTKYNKITKQQKFILLRLCLIEKKTIHEVFIFLLRQLRRSASTIQLQRPLFFSTRKNVKTSLISLSTLLLTLTALIASNKHPMLMYPSVVVSPWWPLKPSRLCQAPFPTTKQERLRSLLGRNPPKKQDSRLKSIWKSLWTVLIFNNLKSLGLKVINRTPWSFRRKPSGAIVL